MSPRNEARLHLQKAQEFLEAAKLNLDAGLHNPAASDAVLSGINSKDAICLKLVGRTSKSQNHNEAPTELERAGRRPKELAPTLKRLIGLKSKSQYQTVSISPKDAANAVEWAQKLLDGAVEIVND